MIFFSLNSTNTKMTYIIWALIGGILAYAIIEVILNRGFKTLLRSLPMGVCMVVFTVGASLTIIMGGFGYENRIPQPDQIASVEINYRGRFGESGTPMTVTLVATDSGVGTDIRPSINTNSIPTVSLTDPKDIETVLGFHSDVVNKKYRNDYGLQLEPGESFVWSNTEITYHLKGGRKFTRYYNGVSSYSLLKLASLETSGEFLQQTHGAFFTQAEDIINWTIGDIYGSKKVSEIYSAEDSQSLLEAMQADLEAQTSDELLNSSRNPLAVISYRADPPKNAGRERFVSEAYFIITSPEQKTYQFLQRKGVLEQVKADLDKCYAVTASLASGGYGGNSGAIIQSRPDYNTFAYSDLESIRADIENARNYQTENREKYYAEVAYGTAIAKFGYTQLFEDPEDIRAIADAVTGSWSISEPFLYANFYFEGAAQGSSVIVPLSRLPEDLQKQFEEIPVG